MMTDSRLTAPVSGIYEISAQLFWAPDTSGVHNLELTRNGTIIIRDEKAGAAGRSQEVTTTARLAAGDYVEAKVQQNSGGTLFTAPAGEYSPVFKMTWLAPGP